MEDLNAADPGTLATAVRPSVSPTGQQKLDMKSPNPPETSSTCKESSAARARVLIGPNSPGDLGPRDSMTQSPPPRRGSLGAKEQLLVEMKDKHAPADPGGFCAALVTW